MYIYKITKNSRSARLICIVFIYTYIQKITQKITKNSSSARLICIRCVYITKNTKRLIKNTKQNFNILWGRGAEVKSIWSKYVGLHMRYKGKYNKLRGCKLK